MHRRMAYSKFTEWLREAAAAQAEAEARGVPLDEVRGERSARRAVALRDQAAAREEAAHAEPSRREFLEKAAKAAAVAAAAYAVGRPVASYATTPRIVVVGAGLAGVRFAHYLWNNRANPLPAAIYEANTRIGGRTWTNRNYFAGGQWAEHGAEFVSSEHTSLRQLAAKLGLSLEVVSGGSDPTGIQTFWINNAYYSYQQANADFLNALPAMRAAFKTAPFPQLYNKHTAAGVKLDHMSVPEWLDQNVAGGSGGKFGQLMLTNVLSEFGGEPTVQSALNLIYTLAYNTQLCPLAGTDEKYHIIGGNDQVVSLMAAQLPQSPIIMGTSLIALKENANQTYTCTFQQGAKTFDVVADHVVLALPFTTLTNVDLSQAGLSPLKLTAINNYKLGTNAKLALQFNSRPWNVPDGFNGVCYSDPANFQTSWDVTAAQPGPLGILVDFPGGNAGGPGAFGSATDHGPAPAAVAENFLSHINAPFPGCSAAYNGMAYLDWWATDPYHFGAYSYYQVGQTTQFSGYEQVREGNIHFCGEHTSIGFQGYMEGAVESAERLARRWPAL